MVSLALVSEQSMKVNFTSVAGGVLQGSESAELRCNAKLMECSLELRWETPSNSGRLQGSPQDS